jgi:hypothetical protein
MSRPISWLAPAAAVLGLCLPGPAAAQQVVPPGNSAVNQYTETYPTAGGGAPADTNGQRSPAESLGARNARKLEGLGSEGRDAAELAAATAPAAGAAPRGARAGGGGDPAGGRGAGGGAEPPAGSSGLGEVLEQATGTSGGELGLLLPLAILAAVAGSLAFLWRRTRPGASTVSGRRRGSGG